MYSILYVDDEPGLLEVAKLFLEQDGQFTVDTVTSASRALEALRSGKYDAIISDYQMPGMDGIGFLQRVRASGNTIPFIIFTGRGREEIVIQALNEGADFYLQKGGEPVSQFTELAHKIRQAVQQRKAEASIHDHERREADILNFLPDATFAIDIRGMAIAWNRAMEKMTGVPSSEMIGKGNYEYAIPFYHERRPILIDLVLNNDPDIADRYPYIKRDGKTLFSEITIPHFNEGRGAALWFTASPLYDTGGNIVGAIESIREITEWKRTEEALNESEKFLNSVVENIPDMIFVKDAKNFRFVRFNKAGEELLGYSRKELDGKNDYDFFPKDEADFFTKNDRGVIASRRAVDIPEEKIQTRSRGERILHTKKIPILDDTGTPVYLMGISEDITDQRRADNELKNSVTFLNSLIDQSPTPTWISDEKGTLIRINRACCDLLKITENDVMGKYSIFHDNLVIEQGFLPRIRDVFDKGVVAHFQITYDTSRLTTLELDKRVSLFLDVTIFPIRDSQGKITHAVIQHADITKRKQAETAMRESEQKYRTVFETTGTATVLIENDSTISLANSEFERLSGYRKNEIENRKKWTEFVVQEDLDRMLAQHMLRRQNNASALKHYEFRFRTHSGDLRDIYLTIDVIPGTTRSVASLLDITERKRAENSLIAANREYINLLEQIQDVYYRSDVKGRLIRASRSWATLLGFEDLSECLGRDIARDFYMNPDDRKQFLEEVYRDGKVTDYEVLLKRKDGTPVHVSTSSHLYRDPAGNILGIEGTFRDITEQKQQEHILRTQRDLGLRLQLLRGREEILDACLNAAIEISGMDAGGIYLVDEAVGSVDLIVSRNLGKDFLSTISRCEPGSANARIVSAGKPIYTQYGKTGISHSAIQEREGLRAAAIIPVISGGKAIACLNITSHTKDSIPADARIALETIATQIGAAIERIRADEALAKSEQRYRNVVEDQTELISRFLPDGTHIFVNEAYCRYFGLKREDVLKHRFRPNIPLQDREQVRLFFASLTPDHPVDIIEHRIIMPDGSVRWQRWSDRAIFDSSGNVTEYQSVGRDVTDKKVAEIRLKESEERYRRITENALDMIYRMSLPDGRYEYVSSGSASLTGYAPEEFYADPGIIRTLIHPDWQEYFRQQWSAMLKGNVPPVYEFRIIDRAGRERWINQRNVLVTGEQGQPVAIEGIVTDITDRRRADQALTESEEKFRTIVNTTSEWIWETDPEGRHSYANPAVTSILGYSPEEIITADTFCLIHPEDRQRIRNLMASCVLERKGWRNVVIRWQHKDGTYRYLESNAIPVVSGNGDLIGFRGADRDITTRKLAEEALRESENRLRLITEMMVDQISQIDRNRTILYISPSVERLMGYKPADLTGHPVTDYIHPDDTERVIRETRAAIDRHLPSVRLEYRYCHSNGEYRWFESEARILYNDAGEYDGAVFASRDITERKQAEEQLKETRERFQTIFENSPLGIAIVSPDFTFRMVNRQFCGMLQYSEKELLTKSFTDITHTDHLPADITESRKVYTGEREVYKTEKRYLKKDGSVLWASLTASPVKDEDGRVLYTIGLIEDITERKQAEERLVTAYREYQTLLDQIQDVYYRSDAEGRLVRISRSFIETLGYQDTSELLGKNIAEDFYVNPRDRIPFLEEITRHGKVTNYEVQLKRRDGTPVTISASSHFWYRPDGSLGGVEGTFRDITEQKRAERTIAETNKKINLLSSITRHDVANQVSVLKGYAKMALMKKPDPVVADLLAKIDTAASTIARQIAFTRAYQELGMHAPGWHRIRDIVEQQKTAAVSLSCSCDAEIFADRMIERVFYNLFDNAARHGERVTAITVRCRQAPEGELVITVEDNGAGIPLEEKEEIFLKGFGKNTGFGLFLVREILAITDISIRECGIPGTGARFEITVPKGGFRLTP